MATPMHRVKSDAISHIGHDAKTGTIHVTFKSGGTHPFGPFTAAQFEAFRSAGSIGKHFHTYIRKRALN